MKPRIGVRPIAGASTGLLLLLLAGYLFHQHYRTDLPVAPPKGPVDVSPADSSLPDTDTIAGGGSDAFSSADTSLDGRVPATAPAAGRHAPAPRAAVSRAAAPRAAAPRAAASQPRVKPAAPPAVRVSAGFHWAGGRTRRKVAGEMPVGEGVRKKTRIVFEATVSASGRVTKLSVLQGTRIAGLLDRTRKAVRTWRFESLPASRKGAAERCRITLTFRPPGG